MTRVTGVVQRNTLVLVGISFLLGAVVGLVVLGWWLWPVQWINATPADLHVTWQRTYLAMAADSYAQTGDAEAARQRIEALVTPNRTETQLAQEIQAMAQVRASANDPGGAGRLLALAGVLAGQPAVGPTTAPATAPVAAAPQAATPVLSRFLHVFGLVILVLVILAGLLLLVYFLQSRTIPEPAAVESEPLAVRTAGAGVRTAAESQPVPAITSTVAPPPPQTAEVAPAPAEPATLGPFVATYNLGDIDFDMSFGIEAPSGDFLGECGLGMAETVGSGDVQRVTAFEVWLFDKTDIRTVSVVLASAYAHADAALRTKLASRGEIVLAEPTGKFSVKTSSLRLDGRILDMAYGGGDAPAQSYFTTFSVELRPVLLAQSQAEEAAAGGL